MYTLKVKSMAMLAAAQEEQEQTRASLQKEVEVQQEKILQVADAVMIEGKQLRVLKHYKNKEYPVRLVKVEQLKENQIETQTKQMEELEEVKLQEIEEKEHYNQHFQAIKAKFEARAVEVVQLFLV